MPEDLIALMRLLCGFWDRQHEADQKLETDPAAAMKDAVQLALGLIMEIARYRQPAPYLVPGAALRRLLAAFDDLESGIVGLALQPKPENKHGGNYLPLETRLERVEPAVAMELLIKAGRGWEKAAEDVVRMLGNNHRVFVGHQGVPWRIVARWRAAIISGKDPDAKQKFDAYLEFVTEFLNARGGTADDLVKIARITLSELDHFT